MIKTPKFDKAIGEILENLEPHQRNCKQCGANFDIFAEDIEFYKKFQVPAPTLCRECRMQRRLGYRINFLPVFYKKNCSAPDHTEKIISFYSDKNPVKVYDDEYYFSDKWDGLEFGMDYNIDKPFFDQLHGLMISAPHQSLFRDFKSIDCDYVVSGVSSKNCYYVAVPYYSENIYYGSIAVYSGDCVNVVDVDKCNKCFESVYLIRCYNCAFCYECVECMNSRFLFGCHNCSDCLGCVNLRNKKYCFFNKQLEKEEYEKRVKEINLGKRTILRDYQKKFQDFMAKNAVRKNLNNSKTENCLGDNLHDCKNCFMSFRVIGNSENMRYVFYTDNGTDMMDIFGSSKSSMLYDSTGITESSRIKFSVMIRNSMDLEYCVECRNCEHCFGCVGLNNKKFCIFNKQYAETDYWPKIDEIKTGMLKNGEYGEFFPLSISPCPYNDSSANEEFILSRDDVFGNDWHWEDHTESNIDLSRFAVIKGEDLPDDIKDISEDILNKAVICEETKKPFIITKFEFDFYRGNNLSLPAIHPFERLKRLLALKRHPFLYKYPCSKCGEIMHSSVDPAKKLKVYCRECYLNDFS